MPCDHRLSNAHADAEDGIVRSAAERLRLRSRWSTSAARGLGDPEIAARVRLGSRAWGVFDGSGISSRPADIGTRPNGQPRLARH
jgi:hypothetical protein